VDTVLGGDVSRVTSYSTRFAGVVFPGETLRISMWSEGEGGAGRVKLAVTAVERDEAPVLSGAVVEHS
ncbi:MAG TPA: MaoC/PaaZ C-terminal domain-containing protein, partial [Streptomyces sp.]|nr:MaoC/PaaZ C-terminal domain-containing protein [Streptomyces sp.]